MNQCPICGFQQRPEDYQLIPNTGGRDVIPVRCPFCGDFLLTGTVYQVIGQNIQPGSLASRILSHVIRRAQDRQEWPEFGMNHVEEILKRWSLPTVQEQADNLLLHMAEREQDASYGGEPYPLDFSDAGAIIGARNPTMFDLVISGLMEEGYVIKTDPTVDGRSRLEAGGYWLTFQGWKRYEVLSKGSASLDLAFIAMKFGEADLDEFVENHLRQAVRQTGFELRKVDDLPRAGLIDDQIRVDIRRARFVIVDLTHGNRGAYWEAGYAEGLGKPVIYLCREDVFDDLENKNHPHFDTNHHYTIVWNQPRAAEAAARLKATIRATIPDAKQSDDKS